MRDGLSRSCAHDYSRLRSSLCKEKSQMHHGVTTAIAVLAAAAITLLPAAPAFADSTPTATPIKHLVVIFQENVSFDHYFGTYPTALNPSGEPSFHAAGRTPSVNGLGVLVNGQPQGVLLTNNPNANNPANGTTDIN